MSLLGAAMGAALAMIFIGLVLAFAAWYHGGEQRTGTIGCAAILFVVGMVLMGAVVGV